MHGQQNIKIITVLEKSNMTGLTENSAPYVETEGYLSLLIQINLVHTLTTCVSKSKFNIIFSCKLKTKQYFFS